MAAQEWNDIDAVAQHTGDGKAMAFLLPLGHHASQLNS